ncbi:MAG: hypothetical protein ACR2J7_09870 [Luteimonas sp.]
MSPRSNWVPEKRQAQQARERAERRAGNASRNLASAGLPRIVAGNRKRAAETTLLRQIAGELRLEAGKGATWTRTHGFPSGWTCSIRTAPWPKA